MAENISKDKKNIKILYVHATFNGHGGATVIARNTADMFNKNGYESAIFTRKGTYKNDYEYAKYFPDYKKAETLKEKINNLYNFNAQKKMKLMLEDFKPNIVHIHNIFYPQTTYSILKPCFDKKIPVVMTIHDSYLLCPTTKLLIGNKKFCSKKLCKGYNKFHCVFNKCNQEGLYIDFVLSIMAFANKITGYDKKITRFIAPSEALKTLITTNDKDIKPEKVVVINNYLANSEFKNVIPNYSNKGYFLYVGRLVNEKGLQYLLRAVKDLPKEIKFHIVGDGDYEENLKKYAKENNLDNVLFLGYKNREEIKDEYQNCIATILPSTCFETFGLSNIESFINGKPVIGSNMGGIPEVVDDKKNGLIFESNNIEQLKECILKYWNNRDLVVEHGKNGYEKVISKYTEELYYNKLNDLYKEILNGK